VLNAIPATAGSVSDSYIVSMAGSKLTGTQVIPKATLPTGSVLQVVQGILPTGLTSTSSTYIDTGLSATITPTSATSKILIITSATAGIHGYVDSYYFTIFRNSTNISYGATGTPAMARQYQPNGYQNASDGFQNNLSYLDSPATTSATTYSVRIKNDGNGSTMYFGRIVSSADGHGGAIQLMEISA
jgi:hypothetical protein